MDQAEQYYNIFSQFWDIGENIIEAVIFTCLCGHFSMRKRRIWMAGAVYWTMMMLLYYLPWKYGFFGASSISLAAAFCVWLWLEPGGIPGKVYLTVTFSALNWVCMVITSNLYLMTSGGFQYLLYYITGDSEKPWQFYFAVFNVVEMLHLIVFGLLLFVAVSCLKKCFLQKRCVFSQKELCILLIPSVLGISNHMIRKAYNCRVEMHLSTLNMDWHIHLLWCVNDLILIVAILLVLWLFERHKQQLEFQQNRHVLQEQVKDMRSHIRSIEQIYAGIRGLKHDLGNHALVLSGLLEKGEYEKARAYAGTLTDTAGRFQYEISTGDPVTDVIINEKNREAKELGISFQARFRYPKTMGKAGPEGFGRQDMGQEELDTSGRQDMSREGIDAFDISIILKNGLENAFAGALTSKEPFVSVQSGQKKHTWLLTIVNSFDGELQWEEDGLPKTTKEPEQLHGYGLKNIRSVARQYYGDLELVQKTVEKSGGFWENQVILTVMLQLP